MNKIMIVGNVGKEPVCSTTSQGTEIATFSIASKRLYQKNPEEAVSDWFNCVVTGKKATSVVKPFIHKGTRLCVVGEFRIDSYVDKDNIKRFSSRVFVDELEICSTKAEMEALEAMENPAPKIEADENGVVQPLPVEPQQVVENTEKEPVKIENDIAQQIFDEDDAWFD